MNHLFKKVITILISATIITVSAAASAETYIYEKQTETPVTDGVNLKNIKYLTENGWMNINILEADLTKEHLSFVPITGNNGVSNSSNVTVMAEKNNCIAAINADFFDSTSGMVSPIGTLVKDNTVISNPSTDGIFATLYETIDNSIGIDYIKSTYAVEAPSGEVRELQINKYPFHNKICYLDRNWGEKSIGSKNGMIELVVIDGKVAEKRIDMDPVEIPENGYILVCNRNANTMLEHYFVVGEEVKINGGMSLNPNTIKNAIGTGTMLVKNGVKSEITHNVAGANPRSAVGLSQDGSKLYLVSVDGRQTASMGMTLNSLADLLISIGVYTGANLDGGGSTQLVARDYETGKLNNVNLLSSSYKRPVVSSIGIYSSAITPGKTSKIQIDTYPENIFVGTKKALAIKGFDDYYNLSQINPYEITFDVEGVNGSVNNFEFLAETPGYATITANYNGMLSTETIRVLNGPNYLIPSEYELTLKQGESASFYLVGKDEQGFSGAINAGEITWQSKNKISEYSNGKITLNGTGSDEITFFYHGLTCKVAINGNGTKTLYNDTFNKQKPNNTKFSISIFGSTKQPQNFAEMILNASLMNNINKNAQLSVFMGTNQNSDKLNTTILSASEYKITIKENSTIINLANVSTSSQKTKQIARLITDVKNTKTDNLIITNYSESMAASFEIKVLKEILESSGKNVFMISEGTEGYAKLENGIRYITTPSLSAINNKSDLKNAVKNLSYLMLNIGDNDVSYEFIKIYK